MPLHQRLPFSAFSRRALAIGGSVAAMAALINGPAALGLSGAFASETVAETPTEPAFAFRWRPALVEDLLAEVGSARGEGLDASVYDAASVRDELTRTGGSARLDQLADSLALQLAADYLQGGVADRSGLGWFIERDDLDPARRTAGLAKAVAQGSVRTWLRAQLPGDPRYVALRTAYAATPATDLATRARIRANLERWRWMPRDLGADHIFVNVPEYTLDVVEEGKPVSSYTVVVGAPATPTPQLGVEAKAIVVNPWWSVPTSIIRSSRLSAGRPRRGYVYAANGAIRQRPGPGNALGKVKIDMPNAHSIYLHDTPSKSYFERTSRAYSHGCIRVKDIDRLAAELARLDSGNAAAVERGLQGSATQTLPLQHGRPVWLVYFTAEVGADGKLVTYDDPYGRDARLETKIAALSKAGATRMASAGSAGRG